jgi:DNA-binding IclR family transcriptional regulator
MPISNDRFEEMREPRDEDDPTPGTNAARVLAFLREHPDNAFTQSEIVDATEVKAGSVGPTLVRLRERGRVDHRGNYWRISDHDRSVDAAARHASAALSTRESDDETPRMEEWQEHAVDPRDHRDEQ